MPEESVPPLTAPEPIQPPGTETPPAKTWRVGTLVYTTPTLVALFLWLLCGDFAWSMRDRSVIPMTQWYLNHLGVKNLLFGLLTSSFPALIGLVFGPIISVRSDRHRGRWGRRIPYLLLTTPIAAAGMIGLGLTPLMATWLHGRFPGQSEATVAVWCFGIFWAAFEFAALTGQGVFSGLINDVVPPLLMGRFYGLFRAVSLIAGMIFNYQLMGQMQKSYTTILVVIGAFYGIAFLCVCLKIREGEYPPPPPQAVPTPGEKKEGFMGEVRLYLRECFSNPYYVLVFLLITIANLTFVPVNAFVIPYATQLKVDMGVYGKFVALTYLISLCLSYFLGWLSDAFHPLRMVMGTLAAYALISVWGSLYATTANHFLAAWVMHGVISGCFFTSVASLGQRLFPKSRFATFSSAAGIFGSLTGIVAAPIMGTVIDWTGNAYRHTFTAGYTLALLSLACAWAVNRRFVQLGGNRNYVAPE